MLSAGNESSRAAPCPCVMNSPVCLEGEKPHCRCTVDLYQVWQRCTRCTIDEDNVQDGIEHCLCGARQDVSGTMPKQSGPLRDLTKHVAIEVKFDHPGVGVLRVQQH